MAKIKGKFEYKKKKNKKDNSSKIRKLKEKEQRKKDRKLRKQCECNHLDSKNNKAHMKIITVTTDDGKQIPMYRKCKICGGKIYANPDFLSKDAIEGATETLYSAWSIIRNKYAVDPQFDKNITTALLINARTATLIDKIKDEFASKKKDKKDKKKDKKKKKSKAYRINY